MHKYCMRPTTIIIYPQFHIKKEMFQIVKLNRSLSSDNYKKPVAGIQLMTFSL